MTGLRIDLLGPPRVEVEGERLDVGNRKGLALLAHLAVNGAQSRETLATLLWPESDRERARAALRKTLSLLNSVLEGRWLRSTRAEVALDDRTVWTDVQAFRDALGRTNAHDHPPDEPCAACLEELAEAAELYRDDFLAGFGLRDTDAFDDWQRQVAEELRHDLMVALDRLVETHTRRGEFDAAIAQANRRLAVEPLHEPTHRRLVLLHAWSGRRAEAVRQYERCAQLLQRELGVGPMHETVAVHEAVLAGRPPPAPVQTVAEPTSGSRARPATLIGRDEALRRAIMAHGAAVSDGCLVAVEGEAGIGRTALLDVVAAELRDRGAAVVSVRGRESERSLPYALIADAVRQLAMEASPRLADVPRPWLSEAARLVPELREAYPDLAPAPSVDAPETRRRLLEGVRRTLLAGVTGPVPGLVVVDDLQWADEPSLDALLYLADRLTAPPSCLVLAWRTEAMPVDHRVRRLVADREDRGLAEHLRLEPLDRECVAALVAAADRNDPDGTIADRLHDETRGLPLLVTEYLRGLPPGPIDATNWPFPASAQQLVRARLNGISQPASQVAVAAAVIGHSFSLDVLLQASGTDEAETVTALDELLAAGILEEDVDAAPGTSPTYEFRLQPLRTLVYEETSQARRRLLHGRVADALSATPQPTTLAAHAVMAEHLRQAGRDRDAAEAFARAAQAAHEVAALDEATAHLRSALALGHPRAAQLQQLLGEVETLRGDYPAALRALRSAASGLDAATDQARLELRIARIHERRGDWKSAERHLRRGLNQVTADGDGSPLEARIHAELALTAHRQGVADAARRRGEQALELAEAADDPWARALAHNTLGIVARAAGSLDEAVGHLERAERLADGLEDPAASVAALNNLALAYADQGERSRALEVAKTALARCRRRGDRHREAALLNNLADLLRGAGRDEEARVHVAEAVALFADIGHPDQLEPEIWKLVDW